MGFSADLGSVQPPWATVRPEPNLAPLPSAMQAVTSSSEANEVLVPKQATCWQLTCERRVKQCMSHANESRMMHRYMSAIESMQSIVKGLPPLAFLTNGWSSPTHGSSPHYIVLLTGQHAAACHPNICLLQPSGI